MKVRSSTIFMGLLMLLLIVLLQGQACAQEKTVPTEKPAAARSNTPPQWKTVGDGIPVIKLWETAGPEWPQIAMLDLSNEQYKKLKNDPSTFTNGYKIFPKAVQPGAHCTELEAPPKGYEGRWFVVLYHRRPSLMTGGSFPADETRQTPSK